MKTIGLLEFNPLSENPNLVSPAVLSLAETLSESERPLVAEIDPVYMGGNELCEHYQIDPSFGANCVIVQGTRGDVSEFAAVLTPVGERADFNGSVRKALGARKVSLAPLDKVLEITGMEYGSITPFGLPAGWKILVDERILSKEEIIVGGGKQISKLLLPVKTLRSLLGFQMIAQAAIT